MKTIEVMTENQDRYGSAAQPIPHTIAVDQIRSFHPRKLGYVGTRIVLHNGLVLALNSYEDVKAAVVGDGSEHRVVASPSPAALEAPQAGSEDGEGSADDDVSNFEPADDRGEDQ